LQHCPIQAGVDIPVAGDAMGISLDAKKYFVKPSAKFYAGSTLALETKHALDPWVISGGVFYRF
jgi:outer membrane protein